MKVTIAQLKTMTKEQVKEAFDKMDWINEFCPLYRDVMKSGIDHEIKKLFIQYYLDNVVKA
jgi:hypothetical protein